MHQVIRDFPNYRIHKTGLIESCYQGKGYSVVTTDTWNVIKQVYDKSSGYMLVTLCHQGVRKNKRVHRLLMEAFVPNPLNHPHVNHIDGNKLNNCLSNLEWCTSQHNASHAAKLGLYQPSIDATRTEVIQYDLKSNFIAQHASLHEAERKTGIAWQNIWKVCNGRRHTAGNCKWGYAK